MNSNQIFDIMKEAASNVGITINNDDYDELVSDYIADSLMFVGFIVELENNFSIRIPDEYLLDEAIRFSDLYEIISELKE